MATKPECPYCGRTTGLRQVHDGCGSIPAEYTCEGCFTATDTGPCFDDLPIAPTTMTPREAGIQAFYADESTSNTLQGLNAAFDAYEAAAKPAHNELVAVLRDVTVHLIASRSLLSRSPKKAAPSDKMFDQMLADYQASAERGRAAISKAKEG